MKMEVYNLTPHAINIYDENGKNILKIIPSLLSLRLLSEKQMYIADISQNIKLPVYTTPRFIGIDGFPEDWINDGKEKIIIVSKIAGDYMETMPDEIIQKHGIDTIISPDTGPESVVRSKDGNIIGIRRFLFHRKLSLKLKVI